MALAALQTGKRGPSVVVNDPGYFNFGGHRFGSPEGNLGGVDMRRAIQLSSNIYFYSLANEMGVDLIHDAMKPLGFGQITGIDLGGEVRGVLPSTEWKRNTYKRPSRRSGTRARPSRWASARATTPSPCCSWRRPRPIVADGGIKHRPHLVLATRNTVSGQVVPLPPVPAENLGYTPAAISVIREGLTSVVTSGTARGVFAGALYQAAGKTGTAQAVTQAQNTKYNARALEEHQRDHALFMGFAPVNDPKIAVAVIVENAGWGAGAAAPIARRVFDYWLANQYPSEADLAALKIGKATAPIGKPRVASEVSWPAISALSRHAGERTLMSRGRRPLLPLPLGRGLG
jgi:penicillin-binding protein 2